MVEARLGDPSILERIAGEWRDLCAEGPCNEPFYRPEWIGAYLRAFEPRAKVLLVTARRGGRLRAVLPLVSEWTRFRGIPVRMLRGAANVHSCRFDLIHGRDDGPEATDAIWRELSKRGGWEVIQIPDVPAGGAIEGLVATAAQEGHPVGNWESMRTPFVPLPGRGGDPDQVLGRTDAKFRANVRRRFRKLEGKGKVELVLTERADPAVLAEFYELERAGWKGEGGTAIACDDATRRFYDEAASWLEREGSLALYSLRLDGKAVAMHWGLVWDGRYFLPKPAFDESHRECSPGQLLIQEVLRDCVAKGLDEFDFLGPWMEWKADWTDEVRPHAWHYVFRRGPVGRALHAAKFRLKAWTDALRRR